MSPFVVSQLRRIFGFVEADDSSSAGFGECYRARFVEIIDQIDIHGFATVCISVIVVHIVPVIHSFGEWGIFQSRAKAGSPAGMMC